MWPTQLKYSGPAVLLLLALAFGYYGVKELMEASRNGTSTRDGFEALIVAAVPLVLLAVAAIVKRRRRDEPSSR
jgi:hypothetical protein